MSDKITLLYNVQNEVTVLPNKFIDEYMIKADGEYVKIYLLILRLQGMGLPVDVERIADYLERHERRFESTFLLGESWYFTDRSCF